MNFNSFPLLYVIPFLLKFLLHFFPNKKILRIDFFNSLLRLLLENIKSESPLNFDCFHHKELQVSIGNFCFMHSPILLDAGRS